MIDPKEHTQNSTILSLLEDLGTFVGHATSTVDGHVYYIENVSNALFVKDITDDIILIEVFEQWQ